MVLLGEVSGGVGRGYCFVVFYCVELWVMVWLCLVLEL